MTTIIYGMKSDMRTGTPDVRKITNCWFTSSNIHNIYLTDLQNSYEPLWYTVPWGGRNGQFHVNFSDAPQSWQTDVRASNGAIAFSRVVASHANWKHLQTIDRTKWTEWFFCWHFHFQQISSKLMKVNNSQDWSWMLLLFSVSFVWKPNNAAARSMYFFWKTNETPSKNNEGAYTHTNVWHFCPFYCYLLIFVLDRTWISYYPGQWH